MEEERLRLPTALASLAVLLVAGAAAILALFSLRWPLVHDLPIFLYEGFLVHDLGQVPYRDFFEINPPGTMLVSSLIHQLSDGDSFALRIIDLLCLSSLSGLTMLALRDHGWRSGALASACFAVTYLAAGKVHSLQREYLCMLPLALSLVIVFRMPRSEPRAWLAMAAIGVLAAFACSLKPPVALCWIPIGLMALASRFPSKPQGVTPVLKEGVTLALPLLLAVLTTFGVFAWWIGSEGLARYREIATGYYPLYKEMNGFGSLWKQGRLGTDLHRYIGDTFAIIPKFRFLVVSFAGLALAWTYRARPQMLQCATIFGVALFGLFYVPITGKFWDYHFFPFQYGMSLLAGLAVSRAVVEAIPRAAWQNAVLCLAIVIALPINVMLDEFWHWKDDKPYVVKGGRVDLIARFLEENTEPTDTVMAFDTTSGALHGLYRARRPMYGRFVYDYLFYHHIDTPFIQKMRAEVLADLAGDEPDYVLWMDNTWSRRPNFPELQAVLDDDFEVALSENEVTFYRRRARADAPRP